MITHSLFRYPDGIVPGFQLHNEGRNAWKPRVGHLIFSRADQALARVRRATFAMDGGYPARVLRTALFLTPLPDANTLLPGEITAMMTSLYLHNGMLAFGLVGPDGQSVMTRMPKTPIEGAPPLVGAETYATELSLGDVLHVDPSRYDNDYLQTALPYESTYVVEHIVHVINDPLRSARVKVVDGVYIGLRQLGPIIDRLAIDDPDDMDWFGFPIQRPAPVSAEEPSDSEDGPGVDDAPPETPDAGDDPGEPDEDFQDVDEPDLLGPAPKSGRPGKKRKSA